MQNGIKFRNMQCFKLISNHLSTVKQNTFRQARRSAYNFEA